MKYNTVSANEIIDHDHLSFSKEEYSRFKYGSKAAARRMGRELGATLHTYLTNIPLNIDTQIVLIPSAFTFVPSAAFALKDYATSSLNPRLIEDGYKPVQDAKIFRGRWYTQEYGNLSKEERMRLIERDTFQCDKEFLQDKYLIFIDDIKITGTHQVKLEDMIQKIGLNPDLCLFAYYAELIGKSVDATVENYLNTYSVKNLLDIDRIIKNEEFIFNTRVIKHILKAPYDDAKNFLNYQTRKFIETLYHWSIGESYHLEPLFKENFKYLELLINKQ